MAQHPQGNLISVIELLKKHKERAALVGTGIAFLIFIGGGIYLQRNKQEQEPQPAAAMVRVELETEPRHTQTSQSPTKPAAATTSYFLKPSPEELLEQLAAMENLNADVIEEKITQMPVLWPAYFFALQPGENGRTNVVLDVSEDGFGVVLKSAVDLGLYPQLVDLVVGDKIWIGGKILAVDSAGTGTVYLETDQLRIGGEPPFLQPKQQ
jgi:hypothetical protein